MLSLDPDKRSARDNYKFLIGSIIPRPIAFVTSQSADGVLNAAPFSYFNIITNDPPMLSVSVQRQNGHRKDTAQNVIEKGEFVVHISDERYIEKINQAAAGLPPEQSEVEAAGLTPAASSKIAVPGIQEAAIRMECVLEKSIELGGSADRPSCDLLIGRAVYFHIREDLYQDGRINAERLQAVSRLAGSNYAKLGEMFSLVRPK